jgi:PAS fold
LSRVTGGTFRPPVTEGEIMIVACAWCGKELVPGSGLSNGRISHGICGECKDYFFPSNGPPDLRTFLDRLAEPVLLVDDDVRIVVCNRNACRFLGKESAEVEGRYGGDAIECPYAKLPQGCGKQTHCRSCTIRIMVADTYKTGSSHYDVPAYQDIYLPRGMETVCFHISTMKADDHVILKITKG